MMVKTKTYDKSVRRSMLERVEEIFSFIERQNCAFPKSKLKDIGLNPSSAENWLKMIEYIQNQPRIRLIISEKNVLVEKIEGKYQAMIRRVITDETIPFEDRDQLLRNYLPSLHTRERLEVDRRKSKGEQEFPRTKEGLKQFVIDNGLKVSNSDNLEELLVAVKNWFVEKEM